MKRHWFQNLYFSIQNGLKFSHVKKNKILGFCKPNACYCPTALLHKPHCFGAPFLSLGALLSTGATLSSFYLFVELGLLLYLFSSIHLVITRPAMYKKKPACMLEMNKIIFRPHLDMSKGVCGLPSKKKMKAETKLTVVVCCQIFHRKSVTPSSGDFGGNRRRGRPVDKIRNF